MDNSEEFVFRRDGEEAEVVVYATDPEAAERGFSRSVGGASVPGVSGEVSAAVSPHGYGHAFVTAGAVAPGFASVPGRGVILACEIPSEDFARRLGVSEHEVAREVVRRMGESMHGLPGLDLRSVANACEAGAEFAASEGVIEAEDLEFFAPLDGDPDAVGRRATLAGEREWAEFSGEGIEPCFVTEVLDADSLEAAGIDAGRLIISLVVDGGELGRLALDSHYERVGGRVRSRKFDFVGDPGGDVRGIPVAPSGSEEAWDIVAACGASSNFTDARLALKLLVLRRALSGVAGTLEPRASWRFGGIISPDSGATITHRAGLAAVGEAGIFASRSFICAGTGGMSSSAPTFSDGEDSGVWEEVGALGRLGRLGRYARRGDQSGSQQKQQ